MENINNVDKADFSINEWFNALPIRIVGSPEEPFFYASDIATVLGIKQVRSTLRNFSQIDIVSSDQRTTHNIVTYKLRKNKLVRDDNIILLTEFGVYRLVMTSRAEHVEKFREFICIKISEIRKKERISLKTMADQALSFKDENNVLRSQIEMFKKCKSELDEYKKISPVVYIYKTTIDKPIHKIIPKKELDDYLYNCQFDAGDYDNIIGRKLYKYTTDSVSLDGSYKLIRRVMVNIDDLFNSIDNLGNENITVNNKFIASTRYVIDVHPDEIINEYESKILPLTRA
jgi:prophage antirepressor-like protein